MAKKHKWMKPLGKPIMIMFEAGPTTIGVQIDAGSPSIKTGEDVSTLIGLLATRLHLDELQLRSTVEDMCRIAPKGHSR